LEPRFNGFNTKPAKKVCLKASVSAFVTGAVLSRLATRFVSEPIAFAFGCSTKNSTPSRPRVTNLPRQWHQLWRAVA
jgi:hypothetical protein